MDVRFHFDRDLFATVRPADVAAIARVAAATLASVVPSDYFCDCFSSQRLPIRANFQQALMATKQGAAPDAAPRKIPNSLDFSDFLEITVRMLFADKIESDFDAGTRDFLQSSVMHESLLQTRNSSSQKNETLLDGRSFLKIQASAG